MLFLNTPTSELRLTVYTQMSTNELNKLSTADFKARRIEIEESRKYALSKALTPHSAKLSSSVRKHILSEEETNNIGFDAPYSSVLVTGRKRNRAEINEGRIHFCAYSAAKRHSIDSNSDMNGIMVSKTLFTGSEPGLTAVDECGGNQSQRSHSKVNLQLVSENQQQENIVNFSHGTKNQIQFKSPQQSRRSPRKPLTMDRNRDGEGESVGISRGNSTTHDSRPFSHTHRQSPTSAFTPKPTTAVVSGSSTTCSSSSNRFTPKEQRPMSSVTGAQCVQSAQPVQQRQQSGAVYIQQEMATAIRNYRPPTCSSSDVSDATLECNCGGFKVNSGSSKTKSLSGLRGLSRGLGFQKAFVEYILHFKVFAQNSPGATGAFSASSCSSMVTRSAAAAAACTNRSGPRPLSVKVVLMRRYSAFYDLFAAVRASSLSKFNTESATEVFEIDGETSGCVREAESGTRINRFSYLDQMFPEKNLFMGLPVDVGSASLPLTSPLSSLSSSLLSVPLSVPPVLQQLFSWESLCAPSPSSSSSSSSATLSETYSQTQRPLPAVNATAVATEEFYNQRQIDLEAWFLALLETVGAEYALHDSNDQILLKSEVKGEDATNMLPHLQPTSTSLAALNDILQHIVLFLSD